MRFSCHRVVHESVVRRVKASMALAALLVAWPSHAANDLPDGWLEVQPGGETRCARDTPFSFFVSPGARDKVVIDFIGGGACWDAVTCAPESATFTDDLRVVRRHGENPTGVYDRSNAANPYREWTHIVIPYCTGDVHWGASDVTYKRADGSSFTVMHRGAINAKAVLDWVQSNYAAPENMLVAGCSAGSYGSIYWTPHVIQRFPEAQVRQFGDSGAGILTAQFMDNNFSLWNGTANAPAWISDLDPRHVDYRDLTLTDFYIKIASFYPKVGFAQFNHADDFIQKLFYRRMGARDVDTWRPQMLASIASITSTVPNFRSFVASGEDHCATVENMFYDVRSDNVLLSDWLKDYMEFRDVPNVSCEDCE